MQKITVEKIFFPLVAFLLMISLGFVTKAEASGGEKSITNEENVSYTTEVLNPTANEMQASNLVRVYEFEGSFSNILYTAKTLTVESGGTFYFDFTINSINTSGYVDVTVQRKTLFGYSDIRTYTYQSGNTNANQYLSNMKAGEYRLKMDRTNSSYTSVNGHMGSY